MPSTPALPSLRLTRAKARFRFSRSHTCSINCPSARLSVSCFAVGDSVPSRRSFGASPADSVAKASSTWVFCRLSSMRNSSYSSCLSSPCGHRSGLRFETLRLDLAVSPPFGFRSASIALPASSLLLPLLTPAPRSGCLAASSVPTSGQQCRSPEVSLPAFPTHPPDLPPRLLMVTDFAIKRSLVQALGLISDFCSSGRRFAPRFLQTLPHGNALALR